MAGTTLNGREDRGKKPVHWTKEEREKIVRRAADLRAKDPSLAGLPLLRKAEQVLPPERRRKESVRSLPKVPWFEPDLTKEMADREVAARAEMKQNGEGATLPMLEKIKEADETTSEHLAVIRELHEGNQQILAAIRKANDRTADFLGEVLAAHKTTHTLLERIARGLGE